MSVCISKTFGYKTWSGMMRRCNNPKDQSYPRYGGRGITVCEEWHDPVTFIEWLNDNGYKKGLEIDRIDNDGNYCPDNCRVVTKTQNLSNMSSNIRLTVDGISYTASQASLKFGVHLTTILHRLERGMSGEDSVSTEFIKGKTKPRRYLMVDGIKYTVMEASRKFGLSRSSITYRLNTGYSDHESIYGRNK